MLHQELEHIATGTTAKAIVKLLFDIDGKAWGFVIVEWTTTRISPALLFQDHMFSDDIHNISGLSDLLNHVWM